ncbi:LysE/ArgO family amino acid transporter [Idiomarina sp. HP20-50]|uniref:LysE/ArgO family amino acid transporter n=1 Tax=Idiomarina sp. HP20-50 TaxID=3070813 RepID=UPI00294B8179|nr:LysE family transporter [Idiomarina sp. HP20-50]
MHEIISTFVMGVVISGGLIIAIGSQNAFLLKTGLTNNHPFAAATVCFLGDLILIGAGVFGIGALVSIDSIWGMLLSLAGAAFLVWYGLLALSAAFHGKVALAVEGSEQPPTSLKATTLMAFAMTFLNPHVYIDTVVLVGGVTASLSQELKPWFVAGALLASGAWFYSLVFVARKLANILNRPKAWRIINSCIAALMFFIATRLLLQVLDVWS